MRATDDAARTTVTPSISTTAHYANTHASAQRPTQKSSPPPSSAARPSSPSSWAQMTTRDRWTSYHREGPGRGWSSVPPRGSSFDYRLCRAILTWSWLCVALVVGGWSLGREIQDVSKRREIENLCLFASLFSGDWTSSFWQGSILIAISIRVSSESHILTLVLFLQSFVCLRPLY